MLTEATSEGRSAVSSKDPGDGSCRNEPEWISAWHDGRTTGTMPLDITVLSGGPGAERDVSLASGSAVSEALIRLGHNAVTKDIDPGDLSALDIPTDVVFVALHGEFGEDGGVQNELDQRNIRYCGSGAVASRLAMNKVEAKRRFVAAGVETPDFAVANKTNADDLCREFPLPAFVKPVASGSSVDTYLVRDSGDLRAKVGILVEAYGTALVERRIEGPELTVAILGEQALPVCEIRTSRDFYDYQAKYIDDDTQYLFDTDLPADLLREVRRRSVRAHQALGCVGFSRVDWMVDRASLRPYALEVNTIPGFTSHSLLPKAAGRVGIGFDELCARIVALAFQTNGD
ncbi:MAG: D-alanine--D-alanine ligase [Planctomycetes bacterium]|nr:D-alanine--D-alanine ligase [Planctomycetota bacterium]